MPEFLLITREHEETHAALSPSAMAELINRRTRFFDSLRSQGRLRDVGQLRPGKEGRRARRRSSTYEVQVGPFLQDGCSVAGYLWVETPSIEEAGEIARDYPGLALDTVDVRPLMKGVVATQKYDRPGKIIACVVLGSAESEAEWVQVMERIDAETRGSFPEAVFLGGARLEPPSKGREVAERTEKRAMFDGLFLESKEVIGGICFLRMPSLDDAVRWAATTRFVEYGTLEIRELWRM